MLRRRSTSFASTLNRSAICIALLFSCSPLHAARSGGSTALIIGKLPVGARAIALSGAYAALPGEPASVWWNPAGLSAIGRMSLEALHVEQGEAIRMENLLYAQPLLEGATVGVAGSFLGQPPIAEVLEDGNGNPVQTGRDLAVFQFKAAAGYGQSLAKLGSVDAALWERGSVGAAVTMLGERIGDISGYSASVDAGYLYDDPTGGRSAGLVIRQIGVPVHGRPVPFNAEASVAQLFQTFLWSFAAQTGADDTLRLRAGVEWTTRVIGGSVSLRAGGQHSFSSVLIARYSAGLGFKFALPGNLDLGVEYAFMPVQDFDDLHALSVHLGL